MSESDFLLILNEMTISSDYDSEYFSSVYQLIKEFCDADSILVVSGLSDDNIKDMELGDNDIIFGKNVIAKNVKKKFENRNFFIRLVSSVLNNMAKNQLLFQQYKKEKYTDSLLQVNNRMAYDDLIKKANFKNVGVAFVDVNGLGVINNMYGHDFGDVLLKTVTGCFKRLFRYSDIYRIGGDELVIVCENIPMETFYSRIAMAVDDVDKTEYSVSIGLVYREFTDDLPLAVKKAGVMMKRNKEDYRRNHPDKYKNKYEVSHIEINDYGDGYRKLL